MARVRLLVVAALFVVFVGHAHADDGQGGESVAAVSQYVEMLPTAEGGIPVEASTNPTDTIATPSVANEVIAEMETLTQSSATAKTRPAGASARAARNGRDNPRDRDVSAAYVPQRGQGWADGAFMTRSTGRILLLLGVMLFSAVAIAVSSSSRRSPVP